MPALFWDASALVKRYLSEIGTPTVHALFAVSPPTRMLGTVLGYAETFSVLRRHYNRGAISRPTWITAKTLLRAEVVDDPHFELLTVDDPAIFAGTDLIERHNLNASDAAILALFLRYIRALPPDAPTPVLVSADQRLVAAAQAKGLATCNPETLAAGRRARLPERAVADAQPRYLTQGSASACRTAPRQEDDTRQ